MGCDTKGVVLTSSKDVFSICALIEGALTQLIKDERNIEFPDGPRFWGDENVAKRFQLPRLEMSPETAYVRVRFLFKGEERMLSVFFHCDCDHTDLAPKSVSMSLSAHGESELLMQQVLYVLGILGEVHFDANDCDSVDLAPLTERMSSLFEGLARGYLSAHQLEDLADRFEDGGLFAKDATFEEVFGCTREVFDALVAEPDHTTRWNRMREFAKSSPLPAIMFLDDFHQREACKSAA